jgi:hypothetical protein
MFPGGFAAVLGNPPWDVLLPNTRDFLSGYDPALLDAGSRAEAAAIERALLARPDVAAGFTAYRAGFTHAKNAAARLHRHQRVSLDGESTAGSLDLFRLFAERAMQLVAADGAVGMLLPSAFHANEGSTGIRRLYLDQTDMTWCLSFENRRRVFDIDSRFKFDLVVARRPGPTRSIRCGFYLERIEDVADPGKIMTYSRDFLAASGGANLAPLELRGPADLAVARRFFEAPKRLGAWLAALRVRPGCDLHMTADAGCFLPVGAGDLIVHEGKTFHQYTDAWDARPRYSVRTAALRPAIARAAGYYRLVFRDIARSNDERTMIACIAPPGVVFGHTATVEKEPWARANADALVVCAVLNSFCFDWLVRQKTATHLSLYLLNAVPVPALGQSERRFLAHAALRLCCWHARFDALWREQAGGGLAGQADRVAIRAAVDAVVAAAYGLERTQFERVLASFSHRGAPEAPAACLGAFDDLAALGVAAFCERRDPLWDAGLVTALASPVMARVHADLLAL